MFFKWVVVGGYQIAMVFRFHWVHLEERYDSFVLNINIYNVSKKPSLLSAFMMKF